MLHKIDRAFPYSYSIETQNQSGETSNFLFEDFKAVKKFMNADAQKRKFKL